MNRRSYYEKTLKRTIYSKGLDTHAFVTYIVCEQL